MAITSALDFQKVVYSQQCCFGTAVYNYALKLQNGSDCCKTKDTLVRAMWLLKILNRYDTTDVLSDTADNNVHTYQDMLDTIHYLNTKCL